MVRYLFYTIGDLTYQSPLVEGTDVETLNLNYTHSTWSLQAPEITFTRTPNTSLSMQIIYCQ